MPMPNQVVGAPMAALTGHDPFASAWWDWNSDVRPSMPMTPVAAGVYEFLTTNYALKILPYALKVFLEE